MKISTRFLKSSLLSLVLLLSACGPSEGKPKPVPPTTEADCEQACHRMEELHCREAKPTAAGKPCVAWCNEYRQTPAGIDPVCMARAKACPDVDKCGR